MSRIHTALFALLMLSLAAPAPAWAADDRDNEIVYRVNLGRADDVNMLLQKGASANEKNSAGVPLLCLAAARIDPEGLVMVKALVAADADVNARDPKGQSALFYAAKKGNMDAVKFLLTANADGYAIDNNGDMARVIAFRAGHLDIVDAIDSFNREQAEIIRQQYEDMKLMQEKNALAKSVAEELRKEAEAKKASEPPPAPVVITEAPRLKTPQEMPEEARQRAYDTAFNACAFQYWDFCKSAKQSGELSTEELNVAISARKEHATALSEKLVKEDRLDESFANSIVTSAQQSIFQQLDDMVSNAGRREKGVGRMDDMQTRCEDIASGWDTQSAQTPLPANKKSKPAAAKSKPLKPGHP